MTKIIPQTLSQYMRLKAKEYKLSPNQLSKLIIPGSSGSLIASITHNDFISEKKITKIANFFNEDPRKLTFMAGKIPKEIHEFIIGNKHIQKFLIEILDKTKKED